MSYYHCLVEVFLNFHRRSIRSLFIYFYSILPVFDDLYTVRHASVTSQAKTYFFIAKFLSVAIDDGIYPDLGERNDEITVETDIMNYIYRSIRYCLPM